MRIEDILEAVEKINRNTTGISFDDFAADETKADAVLWNFSIIGEAANHVPNEVQARYPAVPWARMRGMRNVLIHEYPRIDLKIVWDTATNDLPPVVPQLREILEREL